MFGQWGERGVEHCYDVIGMDGQRLHYKVWQMKRGLRFAGRN